MIRQGSAKLLIVGLVSVAFGIAVLVANAPERAGSIAEELAEASSVLPENEGRLVVVSGTPELADGGVVVDEEANLRVENALFYSRVPYQKVYVERSRKVVISEGEDKQSTADDETEIQHYVAKDWILASQDRDQTVFGTFESFENPPSINLEPYYGSGELRLAGFTINSSDVSRYIQTKNHSFTQQELQAACGEYITRSELDLQAVTNDDGDGMLSNGDEIGDVHVLFSYSTLEGAEPVTVVGRQVGNELVLEENGLVSSSEQVWPGVVSKEELVASMATEDASSRGIGIGALVLAGLLFLASIDWGNLVSKRR